MLVSSAPCVKDWMSPSTERRLPMPYFTTDLAICWQMYEEISSPFLNHQW